MGLPTLNPKLLDTARITAGARIAQSVAQRMSPQVVQDVQRILQIGNFASDALGLGSTGIGAIDGLLGLGGSVEGKAMPLLGGLTLEQAAGIMTEMRKAKLTRKNLFYIRIEDLNPPDIGYSFTGGATPSSTFDMFALDVSYGPSTLSGEKVSIGSGFMDKLTGSEAVEMQITTMDDERGTLKRWFEGKCNQAAHKDGTFGLPRDYCINIEVVHAVPSPDVKEAKRAYWNHITMRPVTIQHDLSRRDQAMQELPMTFTQFDSFSGIL